MFKILSFLVLLVFLLLGCAVFFMLRNKSDQNSDGFKRLKEAREARKDKKGN